LWFILQTQIFLMLIYALIAFITTYCLHPIAFNAKGCPSKAYVQATNNLPFIAAEGSFTGGLL
jgi:hypothetical protein